MTQAPLADQVAQVKQRIELASQARIRAERDQELAAQQIAEHWKQLGSHGITTPEELAAAIGAAEQELAAACAEASQALDEAGFPA